MQPNIFVGIVSYNSTQLYWAIEKDDGFTTFLNTDDIFEVIGNIYDNPELLESEEL